MAEENEVQEEESEGKKKGKGKLIIIIVVVLVVLLGGGAAAFFMMGSGDEHAVEVGMEEDIEAPKHFATIELDTIIVNLSKHSKFLKTRLLLEYDPTLLESGGIGGGHGGGDFTRVSLLNHGVGGGATGGGGESSAGPGILGERMPMIKDSIIAVLSSKTSEEVLSADGKEELKDELIEAINEAIGLAEEPVVAVYFLEFIVQ